MKIIATKALNNALEFAYQVGCYPDQLHKFIQFGYVPQPKQMIFHAAARLCDFENGPDAIGYGGTRGQAKSHAILAQVVMDDCQRFEGLKWLYLRNIGKAASEQFEDLVIKLLSLVPNEYIPSKGLLKLPNGSRIVLGGFRNERDIDAYLGIEYDGIVIEDSTTLSETKHTAIQGSLRTSKPNWRPRLYESANPGGIGHARFKRVYFDPWLRRQETNTRFIHTTMGDNIFINEGYARYLNGLTGWLRRAWRDGDFSIAAGQFFSTWRDNVHVVKPFEVPRAWRSWCSFDYGFVHPTVCQLHRLDGDGNIYTTDEFWRQRQQVQHNADGIKAMLANWNLRPGSLWRFKAGPDVFAKKDDEGPTIAEKYARLGIKFTPANTDRINGAAEILSRLGEPDEGIAPTWFIFETCRHLTETIPAMIHDPHRPEDVLKVNVDENGEGGDDSYDCARYGLMEFPAAKPITGMLAQAVVKGWH